MDHSGQITLYHMHYVILAKALRFEMGGNIIRRASQFVCPGFRIYCIVIQAFSVNDITHPPQSLLDINDNVQKSICTLSLPLPVAMKLVRNDSRCTQRVS